MLSDMKTVTASKKKSVIHVETELGIVNIYTHLHDESGRRVETVEFIPNEYAGEPKINTDNNIRRVRFVEEVEA